MQRISAVALCLFFSGAGATACGGSAEESTAEGTTDGETTDQTSEGISAGHCTSGPCSDWTSLAATVSVTASNTIEYHCYARKAGHMVYLRGRSRQYIEGEWITLHEHFKQGNGYLNVNNFESRPWECEWERTDCKARYLRNNRTWSDAVYFVSSVRCL